MQNKYDFKFYVVRSKDLSDFLSDLGHHLTNIEPNKDNPKYNVYFYLNGDRLLKDVELYKVYGDEYKVAKRTVIEKVKEFR